MDTMDNTALKQIFKGSHAQIIKDVNPDSIIDVLLSKNIISEDDFYELRKAQHPRDRCRDLLALLYRSSHPEAFIQLRLSLFDDYYWFVKQIDEQLATPTTQLQELHLRASTDDKKNQLSRGASSGDGQASEDASASQMQQSDRDKKNQLSRGASSGDGQASEDALASQMQQSDRAASVIKAISTGHRALGITAVDDELFVLLWGQDNNQVAVYSINDYQLQRHLTVPGYKPHDQCDMTSCEQSKCLYMSDHDNSCIHRYSLRCSKLKLRLRRSIRIRKWPVLGKPHGLSVASNCNILVTCSFEGEAHKLVELSAKSGHCERQIALQPDFEWPWHGVQLANGQFVVCHGFGTLHRVCVVGNDGAVTHSYGGEWGSDVGQVSYPSHLAVNEDSQFVFVADEYNKRVVLLSPTLEFIRYVSEDLSFPCRLYFHPLSRRLFVAQCPAEVIVVQF